MKHQTMSRLDMSRKERYQLHLVRSVVCGLWAMVIVAICYSGIWYAANKIQGSLNREAALVVSRLTWLAASELLSRFLFFFALHLAGWRTFFRFRIGVLLCYAWRILVTALLFNITASLNELQMSINTSETETEFRLTAGLNADINTCFFIVFDYQLTGWILICVVWVFQELYAFDPKAEPPRHDYSPILQPLSLCVQCLSNTFEPICQPACKRCDTNKASEDCSRYMQAARRAFDWCPRPLWMPVNLRGLEDDQASTGGLTSTNMSDAAPVLELTNPQPISINSHSATASGDLKETTYALSVTEGDDRDSLSAPRDETPLNQLDDL